MSDQDGDLLQAVKALRRSLREKADALAAESSWRLAGRYNRAFRSLDMAVMQLVGERGEKKRRPEGLNTSAHP